MAPWSLFQELAVGGLHSIGFVPGTEVLLIVSQSAARFTTRSWAPG
jgi:hypothetical protein